jgi:DNA repair exonuclease SbcCD ATPase subunit
MAGEVERITSASASGDDTARRLEQLERQLNDLEAQRQSEIGELQRAREALAETQAQLIDAQGRFRDAESRARELERELEQARSAAPAEVPEPEPTREPVGVGAPASPTFAREEEAPMSSFAARLSSLRQEIAQHVGEVAGVSPDGSDGEGDEPISLRERLARAAAERQRTS